MVLQDEVYPIASFPKQSYAHEEYYKENHFKDGYSHKEDYYKNDYYGNNSSIHTRPSFGIHSPYGASHHANGSYGGGYAHHSPYGHGHNGGPAYSHHGAVNNGYGTPQGSHIPFGSTRFVDNRYEYHHQGQNSTRPYYEHNDHNSWCSKDVDY